MGDKDYDDRQKAEAFQAAREASIRADEEATEKKREKRKRKKDNAERNKMLRKEGQGINKFAGDGSFLEMMAKMDPEELKAQIEKDKQGASSGSTPTVPVISAKQMDSSANIKIRD